MSGAAGAAAGAATAAAAGAAAPVAWGAAMRARWDHLLGDHPERDGIMDKMSRRLASSTADVYGGHYARFYRWCEAQPDQPSALPASTGTVLRWLEADVTAGGKVRAGSLQPYLSAITIFYLSKLRMMMIGMQTGSPEILLRQSVTKDRWN